MIIPVTKRRYYLKSIALAIGLLGVLFVGILVMNKVNGLGPAIEGAGYRLFATSSSTTPGSPLAATNTAAQLTTAGQTFRLRTGITTRPDAVDITVIEPGWGVSCAIVSGLVYCSGQNAKGELGNGDTTGTATNTFGAVDTSTGLAGKTATELVVGPLNNTNVYVCAVADGELWCWGSNNAGTLGIDQLNTVVAQSFTPVQAIMSGSLSGELVKQVDGGDAHLCGVTESGKGFCFGTNGSGRLGDGTSTTRRKPTELNMTGVLAGKSFTKMTAMSGSSCGIASGAAFCWGASYLGNGVNSPSVNAVAVDTSGVLAGNTLVDITSGGSTPCVLDTDGKAYCWGANSGGEVGDNGGGGLPKVSPVAVDMTLVSGGAFSSIGGKQEHVCGVGASDAKLYCWGSNTFGSTARGLSSSITARPTLATSTGSLAGKTVTYTMSGRSTTCAIASGAAYCSGYNGLGSLGMGNLTTPLTTVAPILTTNFVAAQGVTVASNTLSSRLEYAAKTAGSCSAQTTGFAAITTSTPIAWSTNGSVTSGTTISSSGNDPYSGSNTTLQSYVSATADFTNPSSLTPGKSGLWDFSLKDNSGLFNQTYCVRLAESGGTPYTSYTSYPEITTATGVLSVGFVNASNVALPSPSISMGATTINTQCQNVATDFNSASRKLRVINDSGVPGWGLSVAATGGATALWQHSTDPTNYDYNDPSGSPTGCYPGSDGDLVGGQLSLEPSAVGATITPKSGCTNTGVTLGSSAAFNQSVIDAITLASGSSSAGLLCYWDLTYQTISQKIPPGQTAGTYTLDLTVTVTAQ